MNAKLVERLARLEPRDSAESVQPASSFCQVHLNPASGWHIARAFARARVRFPETVIGRDHWLFRAYMMCLDPVAYHDNDVDGAYRLSQKATSATLKAMLIAGLGAPVDAHLDIVARKSGIARRTVEAFEILFFNVLDRHQDGLYLSNIVYPDGRLVEFDDDYFETTPIPDLILRAAYDHRDIDLVVRLAGMKDESCVKALVALRDPEAELGKQFMGNALLMAQSGLLNQRSVGLQRAMALLAASRSPRNQNQALLAESSEAYDLAAELAATLAATPRITDADREEARAASRPGRMYWSDEAGNVFALDDSDESPNPPTSADPTHPVVRFPEPISATWRNKDFDKPVILVARMIEPGLPDHYLTDDNSGIPASEVFFEN